MIQKLTKNNRIVNWYVMDKNTGLTRAVQNGEQWANEDFDKLLDPKRSKQTLEKQQQQQHQLRQQQ